MVPLVLFGTILTYLFCRIAGRKGKVVQIGRAWELGELNYLLLQVFF